MSLRYLLLIGALASSAALAQAPPAEKGSLSPEQKQRVQEARKKAAQACKAERGDAHRDCMQREMCAQAKDPAKCNERIANVRDARQKATEACKGAQPDKHRECMRHELCASAKDPVKCEARAKEQAERRNAARKPSS